jgi:hypothetical protein
MTFTKYSLYNKLNVFFMNKRRLARIQIGAHILRSLWHMGEAYV